MKSKAKKRPRGRAKIKGLRRVNITITTDERRFLESFGDGRGIVAGIRVAIDRLKNDTTR